MGGDTSHHGGLRPFITKLKSGFGFMKKAELRFKINFKIILGKFIKPQSSKHCSRLTACYVLGACHSDITFVKETLFRL
jgi:hypothetical protein